MDVGCFVGAGTTHTRGTYFLTHRRWILTILCHSPGRGSTARINGQMQSERSLRTTQSIFLPSQLVSIEVKAQKAPVIGYHQIEDFTASTSLDIYASCSSMILMNQLVIAFVSFESASVGKGI